ncbi:hypothetical protein LPJ78_001969 [Coemansia sp. RSA 989]|nr:hypothetical protein BX667DRAFT_100310 [Coemansia mojavensis]KAJ1866312.1 hypothetical protein LPJ78_001969 [Coemansia sp. RSA 989]KAJ1870240.1 hypothetical protein LPJ55_004798 [Coemansia sp. RSA 990]
MSSRNIHVVVVGCSAGGLGLAKTVAALAKQGYPNLQVTIVDKNAYTYYMIGAPFGIVNPQFGSRLFFRLDSLLTQFEVDKDNPKHQFIQAALLNVNHDKTLDLSNGQTLSFDYLVLATGATNNFPANISAPSIHDARAQLNQVYENLKQASSVLVIGGGAVGVEIAGEVADAFPSKQVTLVHSGSRLLPLNFKEGLSNGAVAKLQKLGVKVVLNERMEIPDGTTFDCSLRPLSLTGKSGKTYTSDVQFLAIGPKVHTEYLQNLEKQLGAALREKNGTIKIKPTLQVDCNALSTVFAVGDVNSLPGGAKYYVKAAEQSQLAAANVVAMIKAGYEQGTSAGLNLQRWNGSVMNMIAVPIGRSLGVLQAAGVAFGKSCMGDVLVRNAKSKDYFISKIESEFPSGANH